MEKWLDIPQLEKETKIPATTVHRYIAKFNQFFIYKGGKRSRRYESSAIAVLLRIKELYSKGFGSDEVEKQLLKEFPVLLTNDQTEAPPDNTVLPALATAEDLTEIKALLNQLLQNDQEKIELIKEQREVIKTLLQDREEQKHLMNEMYEKVKSLPAPEQIKASEQQEKKETEAVPTEKPVKKKKGFFKRFLS